MGVGRLVGRLVEESRKPRSVRFKAALIAAGLTTFLIIIPCLLFFAAYALDRYFLADRVRSLEIGFAVLCIAAGLAFAGWTLFTQLRTGKGTPVPIAPPQKLIVTGPYKLCRNPLQLGVIVYYFGLGTYFGSLAIGVTMFVLALILGSAYHKFVEEKELIAKFGSEYEEYRSKTPFLIPKLWV